MTAIDRVFVVVWGMGFGAATGLAVGSAVQLPALELALPLTLAVTAVAWVVSAVVLARTSARWDAGTLYLRLAVYFMVVFVLSVVGIQSLWFLFGSGGLLWLAVQLVVAAGAVAAAMWVTFYGGIERATTEIVDAIES